jgi:arylsulfatase A-like enzyme
MRFTDAHAAASVCVPSRVAIMTGRYPWRFGPPEPGGPWGFLGPRLKPDQFTLAKMLKTKGYRTGYVGKWHLGTRMQTTDGKVQGTDNVDYTKPLTYGPPEHGFDESFILPGSLDMFPYAFVRNNHWVGSVTAQKGWSAFHRVGPAAEDFEDYKVLGTFADEAGRFIESSAPAAKKKERPFFLYVALTAPHTPLSPSPPFRGKSRIGLYGDFVHEADHTIGRVLEALDKAGVADNTLVIASSDHGAASYAGKRAKATPNQIRELEKDGHYACGPFRGYKFSAYEGGFRVPFAARWPGVIEPGTTCKRLVGLIDVMATLSDITGYELAADQAPDSVSLLPLFKNPDAEATRETLVLQATRGFAYRRGDDKLLLCPGSGSAGTYGNTPPSNEAWRAARKAFGRPPKNQGELGQAPFVQLYDLTNDLGERNNLAAQQPKKIRALIARFRKEIDAGRTTPGKPLANDRKTIQPFLAVPPFVWKGEGR